MIPNVMQVLSGAIRERRCVAIRYHDQRQVRVIEPHAVYSNERGELVLDGFQTRGFSASGRPPPFWRPFRLKKITAITVLKERFEARVAEGFSRNRLKYRNGCLAIIDDHQPAFQYPTQQSDMGPFLPEGRRRS